MTLVVAACLCACSAVPSTPLPEVAVPARFGQAGVFQLARASTAPVPDAWWTLFNDPVLNDLQARLVGHNFNLQAAAASVDAAEAALGTSRAAALPSVGLTGGATRSAANGTVAPATSYTAQALLATWEVDLWGRLRAGVSASEARLDASRYTLAATRLSLQATLVQTYLAARSSQSLQAILERSVESYAQSLKVVENRYAAGIVTAADVAQAKSQWLSTQAQLAEARLQGTQLTHALALLVGQAPAQFVLAPNPFQDQAGIDLPQLPSIPEQLPSQLLERRPDIAAAQAQVAAANAQIGVAEAAFFPAFTLSASAGVRGSELGNLFQAPNQLWSLGTALAVSLFDGGARAAAKNSAMANHQQVVAAYRQTVLTAFQEVEDNLAASGYLAQAVQAQTQALAAAQQALAVIQNQYKAGTVAYLNVLTAQNTVLATERSLLDARNRQLAAANQLLKNIAGRWD